MKEEKVGRLVEAEVKLEKKHVNPNNVKTLFANDMTVNHTEREFFIAFYQTEPPILFDLEKIKELETVDAVLVGKFAVTPEFAKSVLDALKDNISTFDKLSKKNKEK